MATTGGTWQAGKIVQATALLALLAGSGCGGPNVQTSELTDTAAVAGEYALQPGMDAPFVPDSSHARHVHLVTHRVRHRQVGPR